MPVLRSTGVRVWTLVVITQAWGLFPAQVAVEYNLTEAQVQDALACSSSCVWSAGSANNWGFRYISS